MRLIFTVLLSFGVISGIGLATTCLDQFNSDWQSAQDEFVNRVVGCDLDDFICVQPHRDWLTDKEDQISNSFDYCCEQTGEC